MENLLIAYIPLILSIILSRRMLQRAIAQLDDDFKLKLINHTTKEKSLQLFGILVAILILFFVNMKFKWMPFVASSYVAIGLLFVLATISVTRAYRKLKAEEFPTWYLKEMIKGNLIRSLGLILFLSILVFL
jgi:hypothetical protein